MRAGVAGQLAVGGGEVVVPEQRHLLLQRAPRMNHAEHPALARVVDVDVRREEVRVATSTWSGRPMRASTSSGRPS